MTRLDAAIRQLISTAEWSALPVAERERAAEALRRAQVARNVDLDLADDRTRGQRAADAIARFGGSWTFIGLFALFLALWTLVNVGLLAPLRRAFDPYPFIFLNLILSMLAAIQAPIIMMSQNRAAERDRRQAQADYEVNLKAELEIRRLHDRLDFLREREWAELIEIQRRQVELLEHMANGRPVATDAAPSRPTAP